MATMTNITDFDPATGLTTTTLVDDHDRGSMCFNIRVGGGTDCGRWGEATPEAPPATGATAGSPGSFTPSGAAVPANLAAMSGVTASPATAWTTGQHVVLGDASHAHWNGTAWAAGDAA